MKKLYQKHGIGINRDVFNLKSHRACMLLASILMLVICGNVSFVTAQYSSKDTFLRPTYDDTNASHWFGGDDRPGFIGRNVGVGQSYYFDEPSYLYHLSFRFDQRFNFFQNPDYLLHPVILVLQVRLDDGTILDEVETSVVTLPISGSWVRFNLNRYFHADTTYIFTCYLKYGSTNMLTSGVTGWSGSDLIPNSTGYFAESMEDHIDQWSDWYPHPWDFNLKLWGHECIDGCDFLETIYVDKNATGDNNGFSWDDAFVNFQDALTAATPGDQIWVARGTYYPTSDHGLGLGDRGKHFKLLNDVKVYGGFTGTETELNQRDVENNETILSADIGFIGHPNDNCYHIFYHPNGTALNSTALLDGFTVRDGYATGSGDHGSGAGMFNDHSSPRVGNCIFENNTAGLGNVGGGICNFNSNPIIFKCQFVNNNVLSDDAGGGGGAIANSFNSSPEITNCFFSGNSTLFGGALYNSSGDPIITKCRFVNNIAYSGGAIYTFTNNVMIHQCEFVDNAADTDGGAIYNASDTVISNSIFNGNSAHTGGGIFNQFDEPTIVNCTVTQNHASVGGGISSSNNGNVILNNNIVWGNSANAFHDNISLLLNGTAVVSHCNVAGSYGSGINWDPNSGSDLGGNVDVAPLFIDADGQDNLPGTEDDNLQLTIQSPCIDLGNNNAIVGIGDFLGNERILDGIVDMGAYETATTIHNITQDTWHPSIQIAINLAQNSDVIELLSYEYIGQGNHDIDFLGKEITLRSADPEDPNIVASTIINCLGSSDEHHRGFYFHQNENGNAILDGLTIKNGYAEKGGGILIENASPTIRRCVITQNQTIDATVEDLDYEIWDDGGDGAGLYIDTSSVFIDRCNIIQNTTGSGAHAVPLRGGRGAGLFAINSNVTILDSMIRENTTGDNGPWTLEEWRSVDGADGGGIYSDQTNLIIDRCSIIGNSAGLGGSSGDCIKGSSGGRGGGIYSSSTLLISHSVITNNASGDGGGGNCDDFPSPTDGGDGGNGGGIYCSDAIIINCTITQNQTGVGGHHGTAGGEPGSPGLGKGIYGTQLTELINSIVWEEGADAVVGMNCNNVQFNNLSNGLCLGQNGNINADPLFVSGYYLSSTQGHWDPNNQNWIIDSVTSPSVDAGSDASNYAMEPFPHGGRINMGAFGGTQFASKGKTFSPSDLNLDGQVDTDDILLFSSYWLMQESYFINHGYAIVDGDLSEWQNAHWIDLDQTYFGQPVDIQQAKFSVRWNPNGKLYLAVKVLDNSHYFTDTYVNWDAGDRIEIYSQGDAAGGGGFWYSNGSEWDAAQQYMVAPNSSGGSWSSWGDGELINADAGFDYAAVVDGNWIHYEACITQFDNYGGIVGQENQYTDLFVGHVLGFDVIADTRSSESVFGMLSENLMLNKFNNADQFQLYTLMPSCDYDQNGIIDFIDYAIFASQWLTE